MSAVRRDAQTCALIVYRNVTEIELNRTEKKKEKLIKHNCIMRRAAAMKNNDKHNLVSGIHRIAFK